MARPVCIPDAAAPRHSGRLFGSRMITRPPDEVRKLVSTKRWKRKHLEALRQEFGDQALFDALFCAFTQKPQVPWNEQETPGDLLLELKPRGAQDLQSLIKATLSGWNLSIEQLPFYFRDIYGTEAVSLVIGQLELDGSLDADERRALETYRYWLRLPKAEPSGFSQ
jgi:hypothetical protein